MTAFELDPRFSAGTVGLGDMRLCHARLMNDRRFPWVVLIPRRAGIVELFDLEPADRHRLADEAAAVAQRLTAAFETTKVNIGALGNKVRQFHMHVIVRQEGDAAWPDGVWNGSAGVPYEQLDAAVGRMRMCLEGLLGT